MKIVIDATEPLDIREAREDEEGFEIADADWWNFEYQRRIVARHEESIVKLIVDSYPDHPDVLCLREYLKEER